MVLRRDILRVNEKDQECLGFQHDSLNGIELHCVKLWEKVTAEGDLDLFFTILAEEEGAANEVVNQQPQQA